MQLCNDNNFGPVIGSGCRGGFDFTLLFEQSFLSIAPSALLIIAFSFRIQYLIRQGIRLKAPQKPILFARLFLFAAFSGLQLALLLLWLQRPAPEIKTSTAEASVKVVDAVIIAALSIFEYTRSIRPSSILTIYLFLSIFFDAVQLRTLWLLGNDVSVPSVATASLILKLVILVMEAQSKRKRLPSQYSYLPPESTASLFNRGLFWWLNPLLWRGYRTLLGPSDLFPTDPNMSSRSLEAKFLSLWKSYQPGSKYRLLRTVIWVLKGPIFAAVIPRLCQTGFTFSQPFIIFSIVEYVGKSNPETNHGYGLVAATAIIYLGLGFSITTYQHKTFRMITMMRGGLISLIYGKTLEVDVSVLSNAAAMTLMTSDIDSIVNGWTNAHEIWASLVDVGIAIYLLESRLGIACIGPVAIAVASFIGSIIIAKFIQRLQERWLMAVQKRVGITSSFLTNIKGLKMLGLVQHLADHIQGLRDVEIHRAKAYLKIDTLKNVFANSPSMLSPVVTLLLFAFVPFGASSTRLTSSVAYYTLTLVSLMSSPLGLALNAIPSFFASLACFRRIQTYLELEERNDYRLLANKRKIPSFPPESTSILPRVALQAEETEMRQWLELTVHKTPHRTDKLAFSINDGWFGYNDKKTAILKDINLHCRAGSFTVLLGPIGCGKSTLLKALLSELPYFSGDISVAESLIAYCAQVPWLQNLSLRDNILGGLPFDEKLYAEVMLATCLNSDIMDLPEGDATILGSNGSNLSGGQGQRVAVARAIYMRHPLLLLDDCFSGLDSKTEGLVFERLFGSNGLLKRLNCTVVLATHSKHHIREANAFIILNTYGRVEHEGTVNQTATSDEFVRQIMTSELEETGAIDCGGAFEELPSHLPTTSDFLKDESSRQNGNFAVFKHYFWNMGFLNLSIYLVLNISFAFCSRFSQVWVGYWTAAVKRNPGKHTNIVYGTSYAGFMLASMALFASLLLFMFQVMVPRSARRLHRDLLQTSVHASYSFHCSIDSGVTLNRFSQDMTLVDIDLPSFAIGFIMDVFVCAGQVILIAIGAKYVAAILPLILLGVYVIQKFYLNTSRQIRYMDLEAKAPLFSHMLETYGGLDSIRAYGWEQRFRDNNIELLDSSQRPFYALFCIQRWLTLVLNLMVAFMAVALVSVGVLIRGVSSQNEIGVALLSIVTFTQSLSSLISTYTSLETALGAIARIMSFTKYVKSEDDSTVNLLESPWRESSPSKIEFRGATVSYQIDLPPVLKQISVVIEPGTKIGICGRSGSGKSSSILSLLRMLNIVEGSIFLDDVDISQIPSSIVRSAFNVIPQTPLLFPGSIRTNLDSMGIHSDCSIISILQKLDLWEMLAPRGGLDAEIDATPFALGQKQLLCIARSLLSNIDRKIMLFDEFTSSFDREMEDRVMQLMQTECKGLTVVAVAHRLDTIMGFDKVMILERGEMVEYGTPQELLEIENGSFRALWEGYMEGRS